MTDSLILMAQQFSGLPMHALIGGPLIDAAKANAQMALTQVDFLMTTCFTKEEAGATKKGSENYKPIMISMTLDRNVITPALATEPDGKTTIQKISTSFDLPLLTVMPLNSLAVDSIDVAFEMEVKSSASQNNSKTTASKTHAGGKFTGSGGFGPFSVSISGSVSHDSSSNTKHSSHYTSSNQAKYTVAVHAGQLPLPKGVTAIIDAYAKNVAPVTLPSAAVLATPKPQ